MPRIAVAALSSRAIAESLTGDGFSVIALDAFGDRDTRQASESWQPIGRDDRRGLDRQRLLRALAALAARGDVDGWIAGSGFEAEPGLLEAAAATLPLIGSPPPAVQAVREPRRFFASLRRHGIDHPETCFAAPGDPEGWLHKDAHGTGGWQVLPASSALPADRDDGGRYWQRRAAGTPMSATFLAGAGEAWVLGFNLLLTRRFGAREHVYCGAIGPVAIPPGAAAAAIRAVRCLALEAGLRGLGSLDFLLDGERVLALEVNPRPSATLELYRYRVLPGPMRAHVAACGAASTVAPAMRDDGMLDGTRIVFARRALRVDAATAHWLASQPDVHDLPAAGQDLAAGDPLCSLGLRAADPARLREGLRQRRRHLLEHLETPP